MRKDPPAEEGALNSDTLRDLMVFRDFWARRDAAMAALLKRKLPPTRLRDELVRLILIEFGHGRHNRLSFYQRELAAFAGSFAVRDEVHRLAKMGVLVLENDPSDRRALIVRPASSLVHWCENHISVLRNEMRRLFIDGSSAATE